MAVAYDNNTESHTGTTPSTSEASFNWTHTVIGTPRGVWVSTHSLTSATNKVTAVDYGGTAMTSVPGAFAADTVTEPGCTQIWFLGSSVPTGNQTVTVTRVNDATEVVAFATTVTAATDTEITGIQLVQENAAFAEVSIDDGSPGSNSVRFSATFAGNNGSLTAGANSNVLNNTWVAAARGAQGARETTAGQGSRLVGFNNTSDDHAEVLFAVREVVLTAAPFPYALSGRGGYYG